MFKIVIYNSKKGNTTLNHSSVIQKLYDFLDFSLFLHTFAN